MRPSSMPHDVQDQRLVTTRGATDAYVAATRNARSPAAMRKATGGVAASMQDVRRRDLRGLEGSRQATGARMRP